MAATDTPSARRPALWADLAVLGVAVVWGASYPVAKGALAHAPVLLLIFYRFLATALVMAAIARRDLAVAPRRDWLAGAVLGGILFAIFLAETWGVAMTTATNTALIISLCTVFTPFLDYGQKRRLPPVGVIVGAAIAVVGVGVLAGGVGSLGAGDLLVLGAAGLRAVMVVSTKRLMEGRALSSAALTAVQAATVAGLTLVALLAWTGPGGFFVSAGAEFWGAVAFLSLFCTIGAFYVQNAAVRRTSPTRVSFLMGTEPLFGFALAWAILSEAATPATLIGAGLIVGGTFMGLAAEHRR
ncbi:DMT family transporter [Sinirhodobacter populi]|uniref:DMT family transporter n=1 Tax=Paenirhodobacter populi TaxID=2306993 RepID=A0A443K389_9RHOB|nr:DMT family transporter [Sinirhodobacter populi]RWR27216.1 DMT family transporter [Sinirhodobacter populi]